MPFARTLALFAALAAPVGVAIAHTAHAQDTDAILAARQGQFRVLALNIGVVGSMAKGETDYNAEAATTAAENLVTATSLHQDFFWPEGTDTEHLEDTRALPAIWENLDDFQSKWQTLGTRAEELAAVAGDGLDALRPAVGGVGDACSACHEDYRQEQ